MLCVHCGAEIRPMGGEFGSRELCEACFKIFANKSRVMLDRVRNSVSFAMFDPDAVLLLGGFEMLSDEPKEEQRLIEDIRESDVWVGDTTGLHTWPLPGAD